MSNNHRNHQPTEASRYLIALATENAQIYAALPETRAIIVTGSPAEGVSDYYSDLDLIVYHDKLPSEEALVAAAEQVKARDRRPMFERTEDEFMETYFVHGVDCQVAHSTIAAWERDMATVFDKLEVESPLQKAFSGLLEAVPLYGEPLIREWQAKLNDYPTALAEAMVNHYLRFSPLWGLQSRIGPRDATIWRYEMLVDASHNLLGVLAGLNRCYYSSFQFKRTIRFVSQLKIAPANFAERLEALFHAEPEVAADQLESLVAETVTLVQQHMPQVDTKRVWQRIGWRQQAWQPKPIEGAKVS